MNTLIPVVTDTLLPYLWPLIRISAMLMAMPSLGGGLVPKRVRVLLALALSAVIAPVVPLPPTERFLEPAIVITVFHEILIGVAMGFCVQLIFDAVVLGAQNIAMSMGLGFAVLVDQQRGVNVPVLSQFFLMLTTLVFLALDGHLVMIQVLADSFHSLPVGSGGLTRNGLGGLLEWTAYLFVGALAVALPGITALLVVNLAFGVMSRAAPTLNLFAVGFPVSMLLGFFVLLLSMDSLTTGFGRLLALSLETTRALVGAN